LNVAMEFTIVFGRISVAEWSKAWVCGH